MAIWEIIDPVVAVLWILVIVIFVRRFRRGRR
jgi:hypothetical protein